MKYIELIQHLKNSIKPDKDRIKENVITKYSKKKQRRICISAVCITLFVLLSAGIFGLSQIIVFNNYSDVPEHLQDSSHISSVKATQVVGTNITPESDFIITTHSASSIRKLTESLQISPKTEYTVKKKNANTFSINFKNRLKENTTYTFSSITDNKKIYSWAFQTETEFDVVNYYSKDGYVEQTDIIYVEFTHSNIENFIENFSIFPAVSGTFEHYGNRWVFIPSTEFDSNVIYTVTLNKEVKGGQQQTLKNDLTFKFRTKNTEIKEYTPIYNSSDKIDTFSTSSPVTSSFDYNWYVPDTAIIDIYKVPSAEEFVSLHKKHICQDFISDAIQQDITNLDKSYSFTAEIKTKDSKATIEYPDTLLSGLYICEIKVENQVFHQFLQITDISLYTLTTDTTYTFWLNNTLSQAPVQNAQIFLSDYEAVNTDSNGSATLNITDKDSNFYVIAKSSDGNVYISYQEHKKESFENITNNTVTLQTDSNYYNRNDSVNVFGFTVCNGKINKKAQLHYSWTDKYTDLEINSDGSYHHQFVLPDYLSESVQSVSLYIDSEKVNEISFQIVAQESSPIELNIFTDKDSYYLGDQINYLICANYSNGVPAGQLEITAPDGSIITTFDNGFAYYSQYISNIESETINAVFSYLNINNKQVCFSKQLKLQKIIVSDSPVVMPDVLDEEYIENDIIYSFSADKETYETSDIIKLSVLQNGTISQIQGKFLISAISYDKVHNAFFDNSNNLCINIADIEGENLTVTGVYFDGVSYKRIQPINLKINTDKLNIEINEGKENYLPGETVKLNITTEPECMLTVALKDKNAVNISNSSDIAFANFKNSEVFKTIIADKNGKAEVSFDLPKFENEWVLTISGMNKSGLCCNTFLNINASKDFYIKTYCEQTINENDSFILPFRFFTKDRINSECIYSATLFKDNKIIQTITGSTLPYQYTTCDFGVLESGKYTVRISAACNTMTIAQDFIYNISSSIDFENYTKTILLEDEYNIHTHEFYDDFYISVYDEEYEFTNTIIQQISEIETENLAKTFITSKLNPDYIKKLDSLKPAALNDLICYSGVLKEYANKAYLYSTFKNHLNTSKDDLTIICALVGLASIDKPVLNDLYVFLQKIDSLNFEQKIYLALGFAYSGDYNSAYKIYNEHIDSKIKSANGMAFLDFDGTNDKSTYLIAITSHLCSKISSAKAKELVKTLLSSPENIEKYSMELLVFVNEFISSTAGINEICIIYPEGKKETIKYNKFDMKTIHIIPEDAGQIEIISKKGTNVIKAFGKIAKQ